jgi:hypothetical protein
MRRLIKLVFFVGILGGLGYLAYTHHVVRAEDEFLFVRKTSEGFSDIYIDVRKWDAIKWSQNPSLIQALSRHGRRDLVIESSSREFLRSLLRPFDSAAEEGTPVIHR